MLDLTSLSTESRNPDTMDLDQMTPLQIAEVMNREDARAVASVAEVLPQVAQAIDWATEALSCGARVIYMGAGTSGRLGVLDAVECPPTFGMSPDMVVGLIAGGDGAFVKAVEGAEDSAQLGEDDLRNLEVTAADVVVGLAASGRTPYVIGGLNYAREVGCKTIAIACNRGSKIGAAADLAIEPVPGPEVLTGSTRLKAGTVQKLVLNMISTGSMVRVGKAYQNLMVDVQQTNEKLVTRAQNIVMDATACTRDEAITVLKEADGHVKCAVVMIKAGLSAADARIALDAAAGHVRGAIESALSIEVAQGDEALREVFAFLQSHMGDMQYVSFSSYEEFEMQVLEAPEFDPSGLFVARQGACVVGVCGALAPREFLPGQDANNTPAYLYLLLVDPAYRRRGIGSRMLECARAYAGERGHHALRVSHKCPIKFAWQLSAHPAQHNKAPGVLAGGPGEAFLARHGFETRSVEVAYYLDLSAFVFDEGMEQERQRLVEQGYTIGFFDPARHSGQDGMFDRLHDESYRKKMRDAVRDGGDILVALYEDREVCGIAGSIYAEPSGRGFFQGLAVDPAHGGKKLGNLLFFTLCEELRKKGARYMTFFVEEGNFARKIYDRAGGMVSDTWKIMEYEGVTR